MKKAILFFTVASLFCFSCKKDHSPAPKPTDKTYKINFNVSDFDAVVTNSTDSKLKVNGLTTNAITPVAGYLDVLYYYIFDSSGKQLHYLTQDSTATNFGNITDNLPAGTYTVAIAAGKKGLMVGYLYMMGYTNGNNNNSGIPGPFIPWNDTFFNEFTLTVSGGDITQNVTLNRIVGQLELDVLDAIPVNANTISIVVNPEDEFYQFSGSSTIPLSPSVYQTTYTRTLTIPNAAKGTSTYKSVPIIIGNVATSFTVSISCYDASQKLLGSAIVTNVSCQKNTRTILSGHLFGRNNGFSITLNPWNPATVTIPF